jgi:protein-disulfide isomerase
MPSRRRFVQIGAGLGVSALAGCLAQAPTADSGLDTPVLGDPAAPIVLAAFEDFRCKYCRQFNREILPRVIERYVSPGIVQFHRHDYPFLDPEWSWKAANAARAVQDLAGDDTYYEYVDLLYDHFDSYSLETVGTLADSVGVDPQPVRDAARSGRYRETIMADKELGDRWNVDATPTVFVDGEEPRSPRYWDLVEAIETRREKLG